MEQLLLVVHVVIAAALIGAVLIQRSDSDGFGLGSGSGANFMTGRATASLLTRSTAILATLFIINSLVLSVIAARGADDSIVDTIVTEDAAPASVSKDKENGAAAPALKRDAAKDTDAAAKKAVAKKAKAKAPAEDATDAPAVPTAE